ncbi:MAG: homoserine kinase [Opitutaceae bacterium]|nr:homoserine kinase [Opitutaceae bacterium]
MNLRKSVTIRVPGSTSNCGAGFDTLGMAVNVSNAVMVSRLAYGSEPRPMRESDVRAQEMVMAAAKLYFKTVSQTAFGFTYQIDGEVPSARGLGSSVTVRAGIIAALDALEETKLSRKQIVAMVTELEGHPDNAAASILGGFCVARSDPQTGAYIDTVRIEVPEELVFVVASPLIEVSTESSRGTLPETLPYFDAVRSINSATYLVAAMATRDYDQLKGAVSDFMHEPYRLPGIAGASDAIAAGMKAGALTGWLSGSGSSVMCVCRREADEAVLSAMRAALTDQGLECDALILQVDNTGLRSG